MRFGLITPIVTRHPGYDVPWTADAGADELVRIARTADRVGVHHLTCSEHVAIPSAVVPERGARYYDPLATLAFLAGQTRDIRLATHVLVLPYHHPLALAKRWGTLDRLSAGRVILGVGVGTLAEEFALLDAPFERRGARYEDALRALRAALGGPEPRYRGTHYAFSDLVVDPCAVQPRVPIWLGGRSARSLRRALVFGDGWDPFRLGLDDLESLLRRARDWPEWRRRPEPFDLVLTPERLPDPLEDPDGFVAVVERHRAIGATLVNLRLRHRSLAHCLEQLERVAELDKEISR